MSDSVNYEYNDTDVKKYLQFFQDLWDGKIKCNISGEDVIHFTNACNILKNTKIYSNQDVVGALIICEEVVNKNNIFNEGNIIEHPTPEYHPKRRK